MYEAVLYSIIKYLDIYNTLTGENTIILEQHIFSTHFKIILTNN